jgi:L-asparaginase
MTETPDGWVPQPGVLEGYLAQMPELREDGVPAHDLVRLDPLLDSADMQPTDWVRIVDAIVARDGDYDGFVVLHGTDTMVYTASALSFLLRGLDKPVVLTGSQLSLEHVRTDGRQHIVTSLILAGTSKIPEVCIYFGAKLLRGNRAQKVTSSEFVAFASGNLPPLATVGVRIDIDRHLVRAPGSGLPRRVELVRAPQVATLRVFPGISARVLESVLAPGLEGLVLETYGAGTFPTRDDSLLAPIRAATSRDPPVVVVSCSQCHGGAVRQDTYRCGRLLGEAGVVAGLDMTPEAALCKLYCLLAGGMAPAAVRAAMSRDLAGELDAERSLAGPPAQRGVA